PGQEEQILDPEPEPVVVRRPKRVSISMHEASPLTDSTVVRVPLPLPPAPRGVLPELKGTVTLKVKAYQPRLTLDNVLKASGRTVEDGQGFKLQVLAVKRTPDARIQVRFRMQLNPLQTLRPAVWLKTPPGGGTVPNLALLDGEGRALPLVEAAGDSQLDRLL